ncbi:MAG: class D beta-lactamase [Bacteroidia bacterium]|jgi:beta-lactamase class D
MIHYRLIVCIAAFLFVACTDKKNSSETSKKSSSPAEIIKPELQDIVDSANMVGSILVYDPTNAIYYSNDFERSKKGFLPASTFKIVNSIIGLETKVVENDSTLFRWDGEKRRLKIWEQDLMLYEAFKVSCVPCYQEIARKIGIKRMKEYLERFDYGSMVVDSASIDNFWLQGNSRISQLQQIDFLQRLYNSQLPISERTEKIIKHIMLSEETPVYKISGKTGWAVREGNNIGWWVGYLETKGNVCFFATNVEPKPGSDMEKFPELRKQVTTSALKKLGII